MSLLESLEQARRYASDRSYLGEDPYDALSSPIFRRAHRALGRWFGVGATQLLRRSPWNLRGPLGIEPAVNAKGLALFLAAASRSGHLEAIRPLAEQLERMRAPGFSCPCWGYPFSWQARAFFLPAGTPTIVATSFVGEAFVDAFEATGDRRFLDTAVASCGFLYELHRTEDETGVCLSYSPLDRSAVYNASVLGARLLVRVGTAAGMRDLVEQARPLVSYVLARQRVDGAWAYGEALHHRWIDSFHTGFILGALDQWSRATGNETAISAVDRGYRFYANRFFGTVGEPFYFADRRWPYDVHSAAQGVLTACQLLDKQAGAGDLARRVGRFLIEQFLAPDGHFIYQIRRTHRVMIPYMRWSQAWGVRALSELVAKGIEP